MTTNQELAAVVIRQKLDELWNAGAIFDTRAFPQMAVDALAAAGHLMPDLPAPDGQGQYVGTWWGVSGVAWQPEAVNKELPASVTTLGDGLILVHVNGDLLMSLKQENAVDFAHKILAAHHHEQEQGND